MALATNSIATLNAIRNAASTEYQNRVPAATLTNITEVGNAIVTYEATYNEFTTLLNKIGLTIISSKMATNRLSPLKKGDLPFGTTIEEIFVKMAKAEGQFDKDGLNPFGRRKPEVLSMFHQENRKDTYCKSLSEAQVKGAFQSAEGVNSLLGEIVNSIYSGAEYDEYLLMKLVLADYEANYAVYEVPVITDEATAKEFVKTVRKASADMSFMSDKYNKAGVMTYTNPEDQVLIVNKDVIAEVDVEVLSKAFNLGKTDIQVDIIVVDDFADMTDTYGLLIDKDFLMVYDTLKTTKTAENGMGLFTNHIYHIWQVLSTSQFHNAIRFKSVV